MAEIVADGGCLCGAVRYTLKGELLWAGHCHCESCRRQTSSPITSFFSIYEKDMMFHGDKSIGTYQSSADVERGFCKECGTPIYYMNKTRAGEIDLYAASLDNPENYKPQFHYHWDEKLSWLHMNDGLPKEKQED